MTASVPNHPEPHLSRRMLDAFEREFWAGHHDRGRLMTAPIRVLAEALDPASRALVEAVLLELSPERSSPGHGTADERAGPCGGIARRSGAGPTGPR